MATIGTSFRVSLLGALLGVALLGACDGGEPLVEDAELALDGRERSAVDAIRRRVCAAERAAIERELDAALDFAAHDTTITAKPRPGTMVASELCALLEPLCQSTGRPLP